MPEILYPVIRHKAWYDDTWSDVIAVYTSKKDADACVEALSTWYNQAWGEWGYDPNNLPDEPPPHDLEALAIARDSHRYELYWETQSAPLIQSNSTN